MSPISSTENFFPRRLTLGLCNGHKMACKVSYVKSLKKITRREGERKRERESESERGDLPSFYVV